MARFNIEEAKNYGGGGGSNFFSLKDDKDTARVRFLINDINDLYGVSCHEVQDGNNKIDVECIRTYDEPTDKCPLCAAGYEMRAKLFIPLYNEDLQKSQIWTRGKTYFEKLAGFCARYNPLVATPFEIEREGKKGDQNTTYELFPGRPDNSRIEDFPEIKIEGNAFQTKTFEELTNYVNNGSFETVNQRQPGNSGGRQIPIRRTPNINGEDAF